MRLQKSLPSPLLSAAADVVVAAAAVAAAAAAVDVVVIVVVVVVSGHLSCPGWQSDGPLHALPFFAAGVIRS